MKTLLLFLILYVFVFPPSYADPGGAGPTPAAYADPVRAPAAVLPGQPAIDPGVVVDPPPAPPSGLIITEPPQEKPFPEIK